MAAAMVRNIPIDFPSEERVILPIEKARARIGPRTPGGYVPDIGRRVAHDANPASPSPWTVLAAAAATTIAMGGVYLYYNSQARQHHHHRVAFTAESSAANSSSRQRRGATDETEEFQDVGAWSEAQLPPQQQQSVGDAGSSPRSSTGQRSTVDRPWQMVG